jgi:hypothetical protein
MAERASITLHVSIAWWLRFYLSGVAIVAQLTGLEPDWQRVEAAVLRGCRLRVLPATPDTGTKRARKSASS